MALKPLLCLFLLCLSSTFIHSSGSQQDATWIRAGYWDSASNLPVSDIDSALFTHLFCAFARINSSSFQLYTNSSKQRHFSSFTSTIRRKNPSVKSLLSIWAGKNDLSIFSLMINRPSHRNSFIQSSISTARRCGFDGLEINGIVPTVSINMTDLGTLFDELRNAVISESRSSGKPQLILVMAGHYFPGSDSVSYPIESIKKNLDWVNIIAFDYHLPTDSNVTGLHAALYGANSGQSNTDFGIKEWLRRGLSASKMVLGLPYHGYAWQLVNSDDNAIGAPAAGPAITMDGSTGYKSIRSFIKNYGYGAVAVYNFTHVVNCFTVGSIWINFDDVEAIKAKVSYAKENKLIGYSVFQLSNDDNWVLSRAAQEKDGGKQGKKQLLVPVMVTTGVVSLLVGTMICCYCQRKLKSRGIVNTVERALSLLGTSIADGENFGNDSPNLQVLSFSTIKVATNNFSSENKLGEGGFGPVYKGKLPTGKEIAVKRLSKTSKQGVEEFKNEVILSGRLQHVNLVRVFGICIEREEKIVIYEYMPNKSLDFYLYDPLRRGILDWRKRVHIIEGVTQGLLYLQEYSNFSIIHRDIKASNILLDEEMTPKISDFGLARLFKKQELEANTGRIVGTYGYVPPEYVRKGIYSMKYDVYSFGVLLLQIISGKKTTTYHGPDEDLNLLEYAYNLWKEGEGMVFIDPTIDDSSSSCKVMRCMQVALLCVQENPLDRPSMLQVSLMLKNETPSIASPKRPAFSVTTGDEDKDGECELRNIIYSVDDATITQQVPR